MINLSYTQYSKYFTCKIENIKELNVQTLQELESFASKRSGMFDYESEILQIPKRIEIAHLQELFNLTGLEVFITQKEPSRAKISDKAVINYGKFKGTKWTELEDGYLSWLSNNIKGEDKQIALTEIQRRKTTPSKAEPKELKMIIGFGKYRGQKWGDLPKDYLLWVASNLQSEAQRYAQIALEWKSK